VILAVLHSPRSIVEIVAYHLSVHVGPQEANTVLRDLAERAFVGELESLEPPLATALLVE
jgi:hypothetical protein